LRWFRRETLATLSSRPDLPLHAEDLRTLGIPTTGISGVSRRSLPKRVSRVQMKSTRSFSWSRAGKSKSGSIPLGGHAADQREHGRRSQPSPTWRGGETTSSAAGSTNRERSPLRCAFVHLHSSLHKSVGTESDTRLSSSITARKRLPSAREPPFHPPHTHTPPSLGMCPFDKF
jgi:hypothetical protein